jgi:hypothetical protein
MAGHAHGERHSPRENAGLALSELRKPVSISAFPHLFLEHFHQPEVQVPHLTEGGMAL